MFFTRHLYKTYMAACMRVDGRIFCQPNQPMPYKTSGHKRAHRCISVILSVQPAEKNTLKSYSIGYQQEGHGNTFSRQLYV